MSVHEMHDPYGRRYPVIEWHLNVHQLPEWAAPRVREEPHGRPVERMMILAPIGVIISYKGETLHAAEWARRMGIKHNTLLVRILSGMDPVDAMTTPVKKRVP